MWHGPLKPYPGRAWAYKVARGSARHGPPTWSGQYRPGLNRPGQDGLVPGRAARLAIYIGESVGMNINVLYYCLCVHAHTVTVLDNLLT
jgi:hypothetical protein